MARAKGNPTLGGRIARWWARSSRDRRKGWSLVRGVIATDYTQDDHERRTERPGSLLRRYVAGETP